MSFLHKAEICLHIPQFHSVCSSGNHGHVRKFPGNPALLPPHERDLFRVHREEGKKGLPCLDFWGVVRRVKKSRKGQYGASSPQTGRDGKEASCQNDLLRLVTKAALWGAFSRLASCPRG